MSDYICGRSFANISKWVFDTRYEIRFDSNQIMENDIVFLNLDLFDHFLSHLFKNKPINKFILITFNSDKSFTYYHYSMIKPYVNKVYSMNNTVEQVKTLPIGFRDWPFETREDIIKVGTMNLDKTILLYMNFVIKTNFHKRMECFDVFKDSEWVTKTINVPVESFYIDLKKSKYSLSPEGTGIDCHRIYECIFYDTIPILKTSLMDKFYKTLPVIIVNSWEEVTEKFLINNYDMYYNKLLQWKIENKDWLLPTFWLSY
jgi:hypothetical protein